MKVIMVRKLITHGICFRIKIFMLIFKLPQTCQIMLSLNLVVT